TLRSWCGPGEIRRSTPYTRMRLRILPGRSSASRRRRCGELLEKADDLGCIPMGGADLGGGDATVRRDEEGCRDALGAEYRRELLGPEEGHAPGPVLEEAAHGVGRVVNRDAHELDALALQPRILGQPGDRRHLLHAGPAPSR